MPDFPARDLSGWISSTPAFVRAALAALRAFRPGRRAAPPLSLLQRGCNRQPANLLEHVPDDIGALHQMFQVLKPGSRLVLVVPAGRALYDYYDRFLHHQRRYGRRELSAKARLGRLRGSRGRLSRFTRLSGLLAREKAQPAASRPPLGRRLPRAGLARHRQHQGLEDRSLLDSRRAPLAGEIGAARLWRA